jgi:hypothetical protein
LQHFIFATGSTLTDFFFVLSSKDLQRISRLFVRSDDSLSGRRRLIREREEDAGRAFKPLEPEQPMERG